jgi:hypothetical protein
MSAQQEKKSKIEAKIGRQTEREFKKKAEFAKKELQSLAERRKLKETLLKLRVTC